MKASAFNGWWAGALTVIVAVSEIYKILYLPVTGDTKFFIALATALLMSVFALSYLVLGEDHS